MNRFKTLALFGAVLCCLFVEQAEAQLFQKIFNRGVAQSSCPGGVCPTGMAVRNNVPGHWTYPGVSITRHLEEEHGVSTSGLSRQQQLNLHDSLHEGSVSSAPLYTAPLFYQKTVSGGSNGSAVVSGGSNGSLSATSTVQRRNPEFRRTFLEAVKRAKENGQINVVQAAALRLKSADPRFMAKVEDIFREAAVEEGLASATGQVDWDAIIEFIEKLIPLIIQLIDLFSYSIHESVFQYASNSESINHPYSVLQSNNYSQESSRYLIFDSLAT